MVLFSKCSVCFVKFFATACHTYMLNHILKVPNALAKCKGMFLLLTVKRKIGSKKRATNDNAIVVGKKMSEIKMLVMCGGNLPVVISIRDCTDHMVDGGKKDAEFIMNFFKKKVGEFDHTKVFSDSFFFHIAANVQKAGQILCAHFPQAMCFHGGKHILSLFQ